MKSICSFYLALIIVIVIYSCEKEVNPDRLTSTGSAAKVKTYSEEFISTGSREVNTYHLHYDAAGRLVSLVSESNSGDKFLYTYNGHSYVTELYHSKDLVMKQTSLVGSNLLIDSTIRYLDEGHALTEKYIYNKINQLVKVYEYDYNVNTGSFLYDTRHYEYDKYSNVVKDTDLSSVTTYEYYPDFKNNVSISPAYLQQPANLVKKTTYMLGNVTQIFNHTYTFDRNNRIISEKITKNGSNDVLIKRYIY